MMLTVDAATIKTTSIMETKYKGKLYNTMTSSVVQAFACAFYAIK